MSKITTALIVPVIIQYAAKYIGQRFDASDTVAILAVSSAKKWKRVSKKKLKTFMKEMGEPGNDLSDCGWEFEDILDNQELTGDCICRDFINDILSDGLDPTVVTDPEDTKILRIYWHCD